MTRFGWSPDNLLQKVKRGTFPLEDGADRHTRWWWEPTVDQWEVTTELTSCPVCSARVQRLPQHMRRHTRDMSLA